VSECRPSSEAENELNSSGTTLNYVGSVLIVSVSLFKTLINVESKLIVQSCFNADDFVGRNIAHSMCEHLRRERERQMHRKIEA
jgi:hypothetical protein